MRERLPSYLTEDCLLVGLNGSVGCCSSCPAPRKSGLRLSDTEHQHCCSKLEKTPKQPLHICRSLVWGDAEHPAQCFVLLPKRREERSKARRKHWGVRSLPASTLEAACPKHRHNAPPAATWQTAHCTARDLVPVLRARATTGALPPVWCRALGHKVKAALLAPEVPFYREVIRAREKPY